MHDLNALVPGDMAYRNGRQAALNGTEPMTPALISRATVRAAAVAASATPAIGADRRYAAVVLLVAEPDAAAIARQLRDGGTAVYQARSPADAVKIARARAEVGILICDLYFGSTHGPQFYRTMREELGRDLAVLFLAAAASINDIIAVVRVEAVDVLRKPAPAAQLADAVARGQARLKRRASERAILRQATELFEASRDIVERLSDSLQSEALGLAPGEPTSGEFDHRVDVPLDGADVATLAATARLRRRVSQMVRSQTAKRTVFGADAVAGPGWNMLLDLYDKALDNRPVSVTSVCVASGVPATTALRRLDELLASGLVRRVKDEKDGRRSMVELTDTAKERLKNFFDLIE